MNERRRSGFWVDQRDPLLKPNVERLLAAFHREEGDRVPNYEPLIMHRNVKYIMGRPMPHLNSWDLDPHDQVELFQRLCIDAMTIPAGWGPWSEVREIHDNIDPAWVYDYVSSHAIDFEKTTIRDRDDLQKLKVPGQPEIDAQVKLLKSYMKAAEGTKIGVVPCIVCDVVFAGYSIFGIANFSKKLFTDRRLIEHFFDLYTEVTVRFNEAFAELNLPFVYFNGDPCDSHGTIIPPKLMEELWLPRAEEMIKPYKRKGIPIMCHSCGNLTQLIPMLIDLGIVAIHPVQPSCNDIYALKRQYGDDICLIGNIDIAGPLAFGTPREVEREVKEHIYSLAEGGGYVCASSHSITDAIPPENFIAMTKAIQKYGRFPIRKNNIFKLKS